ncbi:MAG: hypothetical protein JWO13_525 [Acidobacteriales bacterium]|nr:hypothetical protein [Terriglobales bacterium]
MNLIDEYLKDMPESLQQEGAITRQEVVPHSEIVVKLDQLVHDTPNASDATMGD